MLIVDFFYFDNFVFIVLIWIFVLFLYALSIITNCVYNFIECSAHRFNRLAIVVLLEILTVIDTDEVLN